MTYRPVIVDTSDIELPPEMESLVEEIAENTHDCWATQRISEGWIYGEKRDDDKKEHPDLVPYGDLTEGEKAYDRTTSIETIKLIMKLGYKISR